MINLEDANEAILIKTSGLTILPGEEHVNFLKRCYNKVLQKLSEDLHHNDTSLRRIHESSSRRNQD